ncbi:MAG: ABC transporter permease [Marinilabiliaceae bacterium]|nr:ABC transporter permease [Marinilabiliaceae bacterium]
MVRSFFFHLGRYVLFLRQMFRRPEKWSIFGRRIVVEIEKLGVDSLGIVVVISLFVGAVITIQTATNLENPFIPRYSVGTASRESILLEFSSTIVCLILAGKIGSNISSEIGTMRITEQIDALEIMGVNSVGYLVSPKVIAMIVSVPILVIFSMFIGIVGGWMSGGYTGLVPSDDYIHGIQVAFRPYYVTYSLVKSTLFAFVISTVASYWGFYVKGGALEVGRASTKTVVTSSIVILIINLLITQIWLN